MSATVRDLAWTGPFAQQCPAEAALGCAGFGASRSLACAAGQLLARCPAGTAPPVESTVAALRRALLLVLLLVVVAMRELIGIGGDVAEVRRRHTFAAAAAGPGRAPPRMS